MRTFIALYAFECCEHNRRVFLVDVLPFSTITIRESLKVYHVFIEPESESAIHASPPFQLLVRSDVCNSVKNSSRNGNIFPLYMTRAENFKLGKGKSMEIMKINLRAHS